MRLLYSLLLFFSCSFLFAVNIELATRDEGVVYLASYYGKDVLLIDSAQLLNGSAVFDCDVSGRQGVYFMANNEGARFDFLLVDEQDIQLEVDFANIQQSEVRGAKESEAFLNFQKQVAAGLEAKERNGLIDSLLQSYSDSATLSVVLGALRVNLDGQGALLFNDPMLAYDSKIANYWSGLDFTDERILRTPFFAPKFDAFLHKVLLPRQDKILNALMPIFLEAESCLPVLKFVASEALALALENNIMGIDALGYEVISRYYLSGMLGGLSKKQQAMLLDYVRHTVNCRVGMPGQEIVLSSWSSDVEVSLYNTSAKYTLLLFWEPNCAYCEALIPILRDDILPKYANRGLQVFAVNTQRDFSTWKAFIEDQRIESWVHGMQKVGDAQFMVDYGVQGTPYVYILDENKHIVAKNVQLSFLESMLSRLFASGSIY